MSRIISKYKIVEDEKGIDETDLTRSVEPVIKIPIYNNQEKEINSNEVVSKIKEEPKLQLMKNSEGIVIGIEVQCTCGENILIRLDYTL